LKVLVTGGGGFLGSSVCRQLAGKDHEVTAYQRSAAPHLETAGIRVQQGDITDISGLKQAAGGCEAIIHTAGKAGVWGDPADFQRINVEGTANVIRACRDLAIPYLVHTSSPSVVHSGGDIEGADESLPIADHFTAPIWGPGDPHILPRLAGKVKRGRLALPGPHKVIDTIFIENAAQAHVMALEELTGAAKCAGKAYFVTNNEPLPQGEIIQRLLAAIGIEVKIRALPTGLAMAAGALCEYSWRFLPLAGEPPVTRFAVVQLGTAHWFDTSAAERDFGYQPKFSIEDGLAELKRNVL